MLASRMPRLTVLALVWGARFSRRRTASAALRKLTAKPSLASSKQTCILTGHSIRRLDKAAQKRPPEPSAGNVREDDDAPLCLEHYQVYCACGIACGRGHGRCQRAEEI